MVAVVTSEKTAAGLGWNSTFKYVFNVLIGELASANLRFIQNSIHLFELHPRNYNCLLRIFHCCFFETLINNSVLKQNSLKLNTNFSEASTTLSMSASKQNPLIANSEDKFKVFFANLPLIEWATTPQSSLCHRLFITFFYLASWINSFCKKLTSIIHIGWPNRLHLSLNILIQFKNTSVILISKQNHQLKFLQAEQFFPVYHDISGFFFRSKK